VIPARWSAIQIAVGQLHHARVRVTAKTLANHKSNVKAALRWFSKEHELPQHGVRLTPDWARFRGDLDEHVWERVSSLVRYCSVRAIGPLEVNDALFSQYWSYRAATTRLATHNTAIRIMARAWLWRAPGMPARTQLTVGRCSGSPSRQSRSPRRPRTP